MRRVWSIGRKTLKQAWKNDILIYSGFAAYHVMLAFFPLVILLIATAGMLGTGSGAERLVDYALAQLPPRVGAALLPVVREILSKESPGLLTFGILGTLWVASSGVEGLRFGLNKVYGIREFRPYWKRRLQSAAVVVMCALAFFLLAFCVIIWPLLLNYIRVLPGIVPGLLALRFLFPALALFLLFSGLYRLLPNRWQRWRHTLPGAAVATFCWLLMGQLFSLYLAHFGRYDATYGSVGGLIITLIFFYYSTAIILLGGQLNILLEKGRGG